MSEVKPNLRYSEEHEWAEVISENTIRIGISDHAQHQLGDIVFIEFPEVGYEVTAGDSMGSIESVKTVSELYSPITGNVIRVNSQLETEPELVNNEPYAGGWLVEVEVDGTAEDAVQHLLTADAYTELTKD
ncbi:glycine cleavage system protein GcvH [Paenibacillus sp. GCM10027629]|uniref:glycine cleavage system protein GcvH n=1 Tax=Paenibacillus sp. GCM10027629 TaxID=3273414 RepID=UPI003640F232